MAFVSMKLSRFCSKFLSIETRASERRKTHAQKDVRLLNIHKERESLETFCVEHFEIDRLTILHNPPQSSLSSPFEFIKPKKSSMSKNSNAGLTLTVWGNILGKYLTNKFGQIKHFLRRDRAVITPMIGPILHRLFVCPANFEWRCKKTITNC